MVDQINHVTVFSGTQFPAKYATIRCHRILDGDIGWKREFKNRKPKNRKIKKDRPQR